MTDMLTPVPERTVAQRLEALALANDVRLRRAQLKRDMKVRKKFASDVLEACEDWTDTMNVAELLGAVPGWGRMRARIALDRINASWSKTIGGLSPRQRSALISMLRAKSR